MKIPFFSHSNEPIIRKRADHCISRANIDPEAVKVLYRLSNAGYIAYLVGGGVRDLLLGRKPKDFDVGTDARPNEIRHIFRNCFLIGRRFRLAHIVFGKKIIETSTFRRQPDPVPSEYGMYQIEDNTFGTPEEDAQRRDFTVNGLYYDIRTFAVIDYVGGLKDLEKKIIRSIGDPNIRFLEDPVRMLRAIKFSARLNFTIERATKKAIKKHHSEILKASPPRVFEDVYRLFTFRSAEKSFRLMWELGLMEDLQPDINLFINSNGGAKCEVWNYLKALDEFPQTDDESNELSNAIRTASLYYAFYKKTMQTEVKRNASGRINRSAVVNNFLRNMTQRLRIPHNTQYTAIFLMDSIRKFADDPALSRSIRFIHHSDFPEALAFYKIVCAAENLSMSRVEKWEESYYKFYQRKISDKESDTKEETSSKQSKKRHARRRPRKPRNADNVTSKSTEK